MNVVLIILKFKKAKIYVYGIAARDFKKLDPVHNVTSVSFNDEGLSFGISLFDSSDRVDRAAGSLCNAKMTVKRHRSTAITLPKLKRNSPYFG